MKRRGGQNKTHDTAERFHRIDSFDIKSDFDGFIKTSVGIWLDYWHVTIGAEWCVEEEYIELSRQDSAWYFTIHLGRISCGFGGERRYWICPICGARTRFLYFKDRAFRCRRCAGLNYKIQQQTKDSVATFDAGIQYAREKLHYEPPPGTCPIDFDGLTPPRPRYMHHSTYQKHLKKFRQYQNKYLTAFLLESMELLEKMGVKL